LRAVSCVDLGEYSLDGVLAVESTMTRSSAISALERPCPTAAQIEYAERRLGGR
jgi:hypothetical protein